MKKFVHDYLTFNKNERTGILFFAVLLSVIIFLPDIIPRAKIDKSTGDTSWMLVVNKLEKTGDSGQAKVYNASTGYNSSYRYERRATSDYNKQKGELFYFDPNTLDAEGWKKLGLRDRTIQTIQNYLQKGGHFRNSADLQKVYGLHADEYDHLSPFIKIESPVPAANYEKPADKQIRSGNTLTAAYSYKKIDINTADTSAFISLPGIGSKLASRIISFRDKLGGFYAVEQVGEIYGLPDSVFRKIKPFLRLDDPVMRKLNINTATKDELKTHPYVKWDLANAIIAYREQHGPFSKIEEIKKISIVTEELYNRMAPYLEVK